MGSKEGAASKRPSRVLAVAALVAAGLICHPASAQSLFFDWGGDKKVADSGRESVKLAEAKRAGDVIVSFGDRRLYLVTAPGEALSYPIAIPREKDRWQGATSVTLKRENPSWTPTPSMRKENPKLPSWVPGGHPLNPLGVRALYLGSSTYRIHGTDAPWTIGTDVSKGCIRLYNKDVLDLYPRVAVGASVLVTWQKFKTQPGEPETAQADATKAARAASLASEASRAAQSSRRSERRGSESSDEARAGSTPVATATAASIAADEPRQSTQTRRTSRRSGDSSDEPHVNGTATASTAAAAAADETRRPAQSRRSERRTGESSDEQRPAAKSTAERVEPVSSAGLHTADLPAKDERAHRPVAATLATGEAATAARGGEARELARPASQATSVKAQAIETGSVKPASQATAKQEREALLTIADKALAAAERAAAAAERAAAAAERAARSVAPAAQP